MNGPDRRHVEAARNYYAEKLGKHGPSAAGMDWRDRESQYLRFEILVRYLSWTPKPSVLDVGCGDGEFLAFCEARGLELDYYGIDVCEGMIEACQARYGVDRASVGTTAELAPASYDFVIASGTFNVKQDESEESWANYVHNSVSEMFAAARVGIALNLMTTHVDYRYDHLYYASADELGDLALRSLSRHFVVDHSYPLYELTFAAWREPWQC